MTISFLDIYYVMSIVELTRLTQMFYKYATVNDLDIFSLEITPDNVEQVLAQIFNKVLAFKQYRNRINNNAKPLILRNLKKYVHSNDDNHYGESILEHTKKVLSNIEQLSSNMDEKTKQLMRLVAVCHDLGKAFTHGLKNVEGGKKHTFYNHAKQSVRILKQIINEQSRER